MHELRALGERLLEVVDDRQLLVVDLDQVDGLLRDLGRERRHGGDEIALVAHVLLAEQVAILDEVAVEHVGDVLVRRDGEHAGQRLGLRRVEPRDAAMRHARELELRVEHARQGQVGRVAAGSRDLVGAVCTDEAPLGNGRQHCLLEIVRTNAILACVRCRTSRASPARGRGRTPRRAPWRRPRRRASGLPLRCSQSLCRQPSRYASESVAPRRIAASSIAIMKRASSAALAVCSPSLAVTSEGRSRQYVTRNSATAELYALARAGARRHPSSDGLRERGRCPILSARRTTRGSRR